MTQRQVGLDYDRWLRGRSLSSIGYSLLASVPGSVLSNTPVFQLAQNLQLRPDQRLLDIGCGRGSLLQVLSSRVDFNQPAVGIDLSQEMLDLAVSDRRRAGSDHYLSLGSATSLPFPDDTFDVVTCAYLVKHLDDSELEALFTEARRVLKYGGVALVWELAPTKSERLNAWHRRLLTQGPRECRLRSYGELWTAADNAGFEWVRNAGLRPFLFPPIPRISIIAGKAPSQYVSSMEEMAAAAGLSV